MSRAETKKSTPGDRLVSRNRRAYFDYEIQSTFEAGIVLLGSEVRVLRDRSADLGDAWVEIDPRGEAWVKGMRIPMLAHAAFSHGEKRPRKLLLHAAEIAQLKSRVEAQGMTVVVTQCSLKKGRVKLEIALARGRKQHDKRQVLREREAEREARQVMAHVHRR
jgi:SsrA-binding protein